MNKWVYAYVWIMFFSGYMVWRGISQSCGNSIFSFHRNIHTVLHSDHTKLHSHQQCKSVLCSPYALQNLLLVDILIMAILIGVRWYLIAFLLWISPVNSDIEHLFICFLTTYMSLEKYMFRLSANYLFGICFVFWYWAAWAVSIF